MTDRGRGRRELTAAVIGLNWGVRMHVPALRKAGWRVQMLCGRDPARTSETARRAGVEESTTSMEEVFQRQYDLVIIALPWPLHSAVSVMGMRSCSHLLVEHPLAKSAREAETMASHATSRKRLSLVNFPTRYMEPVIELSALLFQGRLGTIRQVAHRFYYPSHEGRAWLPLLAMHSLDLAAWLFGVEVPTRVALSGTAFEHLEACPSWSWPLRHEGLEPETTVTAESLLATFSLQGGGSYACALGQHNHDDFVEVLTVNGDLASAGYESRLRRDDVFSPWAITPLWVGRPGPGAALEPAKPQPGRDAWFDAHTRQAAEIATMLEGREPSTAPASFVDAARVQRLLEQLVAAASGTEQPPRREG